jgi:hypothetical protein
MCLASIKELDVYVQGMEINKPINLQKNHAVTLPNAGTTSILNQLHWPFGMRKAPRGHTNKLFKILQTYAPICNALYHRMLDTMTTSKQFDDLNDGRGLCKMLTVHKSTGECSA